MAKTEERKLTAITRYLTVGLALIESVAMAIGFGRQGLLMEYKHCMLMQQLSY